MAGSYSKELMVGLAVAFIIIPTIFVALRVWSKRLKGRGLQLDDWLCLTALLIGYTTCSLQLYAAIDGELGQHQAIDANGQPILDDPRFAIYEETKFAVNIISPVGSGFVKGAVLVLYLSIFGHVRPFRWTVYFMLFIVASLALAFAFSNLFICFPVTPFLEFFYNNKCIDETAVFLSGLVTNLIVDILILLMPIPMVLRLHLPLRDRLGVLGMFFLGASVVAISSARLSALLEVAREYPFHYNDETYYTSPAFYWANIELAVSIVSACLPTMRPIWIFVFPTPQTKTNSKATDYIEISDTVRSGDAIPLTNRENIDKNYVGTAV